VLATLSIWKALRVAGDLRRVERVLEVVDADAGELATLEGRTFFAARTRRSLNDESERASTAEVTVGIGHAHVRRGLDGPLAGALLAGLVEDRVDEQRLAVALRNPSCGRCPR